MSYAAASQVLRERRGVNWCRLAEFEAAAFCFTVCVALFFFVDLSDATVAHQWMLRLGSEAAWATLFASVGTCVLVAALSSPGIGRSTCLMVGVWFFSAIAMAAFKASAMPISSCSFLCHGVALAVSFLRRRH